MKRKFTINDGSGEVNLAVVNPSPAQKRNADIFKSKTFGEMAKEGLIFKSSLHDILIKQGLWDEEKEKERAKHRDIILNGSEKINEGGLTAEQKKELALKMRTSRLILMSLSAPFNDLEANTVEGVAEQAKFEYLVSECTIYDDGDNKKYFRNFEDYKHKEDEEYVEKIANEFANLYYGYDEAIDNLPENKILKELEEETEDQVEDSAE